MKKFPFMLAVVAAFFFMVPTTQAQSDDYSRLYEEFLRNLQQQGTTTPSTTSTTTPTPPKAEPVKSQPKVETSQYSLSGKVTRGDDGRYFITTDEKPSRVLRVYGQDLSKEIIQSIVHDKVQLIGEKAFFNGKEVGISVKKIVILSAGKQQVTKPLVTKPEPVKPAQKPTMHQEMTFRGTIEVSSEGNPFLVTVENKKRVTHRLLNQDDWKKAYQYAYKGEVTVRGYKNEAGAIRYSDIRY